MKINIKYFALLSLVFFLFASCEEEIIGPSIITPQVITNEPDVNTFDPEEDERKCEFTNTRLDQTSSLSEDEIYDIKGDITIISDCEIEVSNFFYNGLGPAVAFFAGIDGDFESGLRISQDLHGTEWTGETLILFLPEGETFEDFNSFSVWCYQFDIDFSSAFFE